MGDLNGLIRQMLTTYAPTVEAKEEIPGVSLGDIVEETERRRVEIKPGIAGDPFAAVKEQSSPCPIECPCVPCVGGNCGGCAKDRARDLTREQWEAPIWYQTRMPMLPEWIQSEEKLP